MERGEVVSIHIASNGGAPPRSVPQVRAFAGQGLEGDRYFLRTGTYSEKPGAFREVTLIEQEAVEALGLEYQVLMEPAATRRNIVTRGVALNHLVDREFRVGEALLRGVRLCEPCGHMEELAGKPGARRGLIHRGGLRAQILRSGLIRVGDQVEPSQAS